MQKITIYLKPHQERYLKSIAGDPPQLSAKYNLANLAISLLTKTPDNPYQFNQPGTLAVLPNWSADLIAEKTYLSPTANKMFGTYIDSLLDIDFCHFMKPYHASDMLDIKDGINLFIEKRNLPVEPRIYEMLKKRDYRLRNKIYLENPADFFNELSPP